MQIFIQTNGKTITIDLEETTTLDTLIKSIKERIKQEDSFYLYDIKNNRYLPFDNLKAQIKRDLKLDKEMILEIHSQKKIQTVADNITPKVFPAQGVFNPNFIPQNNTFEFNQPPQQQVFKQNPNPFLHIQQPNKYQENEIQKPEKDDLQKQLQEKDKMIEQLNQELQKQQRIIEAQKLFIQQRCKD